MVSIVSNEISLKNIQIDGRFVCIEIFIDDSGNQYMQSYMSPVGANVLYFTNKLSSDASSLQSNIQANQAAQAVK